jgi:hypothetical protein
VVRIAKMVIAEPSCKLSTRSPALSPEQIDAFGETKEHKQNGRDSVKSRLDQL